MLHRYPKIICNTVIVAVKTKKKEWTLIIILLTIDLYFTLTYIIKGFLSTACRVWNKIYFLLDAFRNDKISFFFFLFKKKRLYNAIRQQHNRKLRGKNKAIVTLNLRAASYIRGLRCELFVLRRRHFIRPILVCCHFYANKENQNFEWRDFYSLILS